MATIMIIFPAVLWQRWLANVTIQMMPHEIDGVVRHADFANAPVLQKQQHHQQQVLPQETVRTCKFSAA
jgi:hypothetical protein